MKEKQLKKTKTNKPSEYLYYYAMLPSHRCFFLLDHIIQSKRKLICKSEGVYVTSKRRRGNLKSLQFTHLNNAKNEKKTEAR